MLENWIHFFLPFIFCFLAFTVNPIFVYLIFTENQAKFGNYRFLLLFFAMFNLMYSVVNVIVPLLDSEFNFHMMSVRFSLISVSYAVLLIHFVYRYLAAIHNSSLTRNKFHWYMLFSIFSCVLYYGAWHADCYFLGQANMEIREYVRKDFRETDGRDSMDFNMMGALFNEGSDETRFRSWLAVLLTTSISTASIIIFFLLTVTIMTQLKKMTRNASKKTSKFQVDLLRALVIQTTIPIVISYSPCLFSWLCPMFGIQLPRGFNYFEVSALGVFPFVDPVAITLSLPVFRKRIFSLCRHLSTAENSRSDRRTH